MPLLVASVEVEILAGKMFAKNEHDSGEKL